MKVSEIIPHMSKRRYRATKIQEFDAAKVKELSGRRVTVAIDVAKEDFCAAVVDSEAQVHGIVKWTHPEESRAFLRFVEQESEQARRAAQR